MTDLGGPQMATLPAHGTPKDELLEKMRARKAADADWAGGRTWSLVYPAGHDVDEVLREANGLYLFDNALNPIRFPSLREMEQDVVSITAGLLNAGPDSGGTMTSGGTESILMSMFTARSKARAERGIGGGRLVAPESAHPAFAKAAKYLDLELVQIPLGDDLRADLDAAAELITDDTVVVVGSAPNYPHGVVDPIPELAAMAAERGANFHTDSCLGGFMLPFYERLGVDVPPFDFRVPGVTTMSADVHKYGYCTKGASVVVHRDSDDLRYQYFLYNSWPGGIYGTPAMAGARGGAPVAAAWAVLNYLGEDGYLRLARRVRDTTEKIKAGIESIPELHIWGKPAMSVVAFGSEDVDIMAVGDVMDDRGWHLDRQLNPDALHLMVSPEHHRVVDEFLGDLRYAVANHGESRGVEARYS
jgi:sphinganine-1-phosphate aldolase